MDVMVSFAEEGSLGLDLSEKMVHAEKWVWVKSIPPESQASKHPELKVGLRVVEVAGQAVLGKSLDSVFDLIISHPERPLTFGFALEAGIEPVVAVEEGVPPEAENAVVFGRPYFEASNDLLEADIATLVAAAVKGAILASDTRQSRVPSDTHTYTSGGSEPRWRCCLATPASDHS